MKKISMAGVAKAAGVGVATVDRVLNGRAPVRRETRERVLKAAEQLGYREELLTMMAYEAKPAKSAVRTGFILLSKEYSFYQSLAEQITRVAGDSVQEQPEFVWLDIHDVQSMVVSLEALAERVDVIGLVALDHPLIRHTIKKITAAGVAVYALFSNLSPCGLSGYIGLDNQKAGRTAGWFADNLLAAGDVIGVLIGDHRFNCQESCEISFRSYLREKQCDYVVSEPSMTYESVDGGYAVTRQLLADNSNLAMIYAPCGGIEGVIKAIQESDRRQIKLLCHGPVIGDELALIAGHITVMIRHRIDFMAEKIIHLMINTPSDDSNALHITVPFDLVTRENI